MSDVRVIVAGASGYAGALAAQLVYDHPRLDLSAATSRSEAGTRLDRLHPRYRVPVELTELDLVTHPAQCVGGGARAATSDLRRAPLCEAAGRWLC